MTHWDGLKVEYTYYKPGTGVIYIVDLKHNGFTEDGWIKDIPIKTEDTLDYDNGSYVVVDIEVFANLLNGKYNKGIGLVVRQIH